MQLCTPPWLPSGCQADAVSQPYQCHQTENVVPCSELHHPAHLCPTAALCLQDSLQTLTACEGWFPARDDPHTMSKNWGRCRWSGTSPQQRGTNSCSGGGSWLPLKTQGYISAASSAFAVHFTALVKSKDGNSAFHQVEKLPSFSVSCFPRLHSSCWQHSPAGSCLLARVTAEQVSCAQLSQPTEA